MYIIGQITQLTPEEVFGNCYRDEHNTEGIYVKKVIKKIYPQLTEYKFNAKQYKTEKAANAALDVLTYHKDKTLRDEGYTVIEI